MAPSKLRKALGAVKDHTSIGLAKVSSSSGVPSELDVAVLKATKHGESFPADEGHIREVLSLARYSGAYLAASVTALSRRLWRTRSWDVTLKALVIVHRLLADGEPALEQELFSATRGCTRMLNLSDFCDRSRTDALEFSAFVRAFAAYLDDRLHYRMQAKLGGANRDELYKSPTRDLSNYDGIGEEAADTGAEADKAVALVPKETPTSEMTVEQLFTKVQQLQHLFDRIIACRPIGAAKTNRVVASSLSPLVKESVQLYCELTEVMAAFTDQFPEMETGDCERVHGVFCGLAKQIDELESFYAWCKDAYVCRQSDVPEMEIITHKKLELMAEFVRDRRDAADWQQIRLPPPPSPEPPSPEEFLFEEEYDMNALPAAPDGPPVVVPAKQEASLIVAQVVEEEADLLNLKGDAMSGEELALALFDGDLAGPTPARDLFDTSSAAMDWETALVESASALTTQLPELGGGLNMMVLDGMYRHAAAANAHVFRGSIGMRPPGAPMLNGAAAAAAGADPFAASMVVPQPTYVQMSDMRTKQQLLPGEEIMWQQYRRNGMQGQRAITILQQRTQKCTPREVYSYAGYYRP